MVGEVLQRYGSVLAVLAAVGAVAAAILLDVATGAPLEIGWTQFFLLVAGAVSLLMSPPPIQRRLRDLYGRSLTHSAATRSTLQRRPTFHLVYGLWFGLAVSLGEIGLQTYQRAVGKAIGGTDYIWAVPLGHVPLLVAVGVIFFAIARVSPGRLFLIAFVFVNALVALTGWLVMSIKGIGLLGASLLAAGLSVHIARLATRHAYLVNRLVRRTLPWAAAAVTMLVVASIAWPRWTEHRHLGRLPAAAGQAPNVLVVVLDTVRAKGTSLNGYERDTTPNLVRLAARGVVFERALANAPWTLPSLASMFTGHWPHELSAAWRTPLNAARPTLAETVDRAGYQSAGFVANHSYGIAAFGLGRGFVHYDANRGTRIAGLDDTVFGQILVDQLRLERYWGEHDNFGRRSAREVNSRFLQWLATRDGSRPFFAFLNYFDAHTPYMSPPAFAGKFSDDYLVGNIRGKNLESWTPDDIRRFSNAYDGAIAYIDDQLGALFHELDRRGDLDRTLVIVTADHGEHFGEQGLLTHAVSLYTPLLHVPLFVVYPGHVPAGVRVREFAELRDLGATILDLIDAPGADRFPGVSLARYWRSPADAVAPTPIFAETGHTFNDFPPSYPTSKGKMKSVVFRDMHYIRNYGDGREELYNLKHDFEETTDLSGSLPDVVAMYRRLLQPFEDAERTSR